MATIIEREQPISRSDRYVEIERSETGGWVVAVVLIALVALGLIWWFRYHTPAASAPASSGSANINVTVPGTGTNGSGGGANSGGSGAGGSGSGASGTGGATGGTGATH